MWNFSNALGVVKVKALPLRKEAQAMTSSAVKKVEGDKVKTISNEEKTKIVEHIN